MAKVTIAQAGSRDVVAMLDTICWSEGTGEGKNPLTKNDGYDVIVMGVGDPFGGEIFTDYSHHPFALGRPAKVIVEPGVRASLPNGLRSTASGRYQIILSTWKTLQAKLGLPDFSPQSQDLAAIYLMRLRGAIAHLESGSIDAAIQAHYTQAPVDLVDAVEDDSNIWASMPGNEYGQGGHTLAQVVAEFSTLLVAQPTVAVQPS